MPTDPAPPERMIDVTDLTKWKLADEIRDALADFDAAMAALGGCGDGSCVVSPPKGMHTNGGCRCHNDRYTASRVIARSRYFTTKVRTALSAASPAPSLPTREEIARVIDPHTFEDWQRKYDYEMKVSGDIGEARKFADWSCSGSINAALEKADRILALFAQPQGAQVAAPGAATEAQAIAQAAS